MNKIIGWIRGIFIRIFIYNFHKAFPQRNFGELAKTARIIAVVLPDSRENVDAATLLIEKAQAQKKEIVLILPNHIRSRFESLHGIKYVEYFPQDRNWLGLPRNSFIDRMKFTECEMVISFDMGKDDFTLVCALLLKSRLKIGFKSRFADKIFQIQLVTIENSLKKSIENLINYYRIF